MKIAWFTPFSRGGRVSRISSIVTRELSRHAEVDIWHPPAALLQPAALRTIAMPRCVRVSPSMLDAYDLAVYNLGEEDDRRIAGAACAAPGIAILHGAVEEAAARRAYAVVAHSELAQAFVARTEIGFCPRKYATSVLALAETVLLAVTVLRCVDRMAGRLAEIGTEAGETVVDRVAGEAYALFGGEVSNSRR